MWSGLALPVPTAVSQEKNIFSCPSSNPSSYGSPWLMGWVAGLVSVNWVEYGGPGPLTLVSPAAAVIDPSHRECWPRKGKQSHRAPNYGPMSMAAELLPGARPAFPSRGACDTSWAGRGHSAGRSRPGQKQRASRLAGSRASMGNVSRAPTPARSHARRVRPVGRGTDSGGGWLTWQPQVGLPT